MCLFFLYAYPYFDIGPEWEVDASTLFQYLLTFLLRLFRNKSATHGRDAEIWNMEPQSHKLLGYNIKKGTTRERVT